MNLVPSRKLLLTCALTLAASFPLGAAAQSSAASSVPVSGTATLGTQATPAPRPAEVASNEAKLKTLDKELKKAEEQISKLEEQKSKLELEMASPEVFSNAAKLKEVQATFNKTEADLAAANKKWEEIATAIDELNQ